MIEVDGAVLRTAREWEKRRRHVLKRELGKGVVREWRSPAGKSTATWYREDQTRPWTARELSRLKRERADARLEARLSAARDEGALSQRLLDMSEAQGCAVDEAAYCWCTAYQWVALGLRPDALGPLATRGRGSSGARRGLLLLPALGRSPRPRPRGETDRERAPGIQPPARRPPLRRPPVVVGRPTGEARRPGRDQASPRPSALASSIARSSS